MISSIENRRFQLDILRIPLLGHFLRWKHARTVGQTLMFLLAAAIVVDGLIGNQIASRNVATVAAWVHYRGLVVLALLLAGNLFCAACPFILPRKLAKMMGRPTMRWPQVLRNKWLAIAALIGILFAYELWDLWATPWWTAWVAVAYFGLAFIIEALFTRSSFCKYVCPLGTFNFLYSAMSPTQITSRNLQTCRDCTGHECINGVTEPPPRLPPPSLPLKGEEQFSPLKGRDRKKSNRQPIMLQDGCQLELFVPTIQSNMDCTFCLDCVRACPYDNVALTIRPPGEELFSQPWRNRLDLALLPILVAYAGLINAFAMTPPVFSLEAWIAQTLNTQSEAVVLGLVFLVSVLIVPLLLVYGAAWLSRLFVPPTPNLPLKGEGQSSTLAPSKTRETQVAASKARKVSPQSLSKTVMRYSYSFMPMGFAIWFAHYLFHFLTGAMTIVPAFQTFFYRTLGLTFVGRPNWRLAALFVPPVGTIQTVQTIITYGGLILAIAVVLSAAGKAHKNRGNALREAIPWMVVLVLLAIASGSTFLLPMEMRGSALGA